MLLKNENNIYRGILEIWRKKGFTSCPSKFHAYQDTGVNLAIVLSFVLICAVGVVEGFDLFDLIGN